MLLHWSSASRNEIDRKIQFPTRAGNSESIASNQANSNSAENRQIKSLKNFKLLQIIPVRILPGPFASSIHMFEMCKGLANLGNEIHIIVFKSNKNDKMFEKIDGVYIHRIPIFMSRKWQIKRSFLTLFLSIFKLLFIYLYTFLYSIFLIKRFKIDVIFIRYNYFSIISFLLSKVLNIPFFIQHYGGWKLYLSPFNERLPVKHLEKIFLFLLWRNAKHVFTASPEIKKKINEEGFKKDIKIIPPTIDLELFNYDKINFNRKLFRKTLNLTKSFVVLYAGTLGKVGGVYKLILAAPRVISVIQDVKFVILGTGELEAKLKTLIQTLKVNTNVLMLGRVDHSIIPNYLVSADVLVAILNPEICSGIPMKILEYGAMKRPVIITDGVAKGLSDEVPHIPPEEYTYVVEFNERFIAKAIINLYNNKELREKLSNKFYSIIKERFSSKYAAKKYNKLINLYMNY